MKVLFSKHPLLKSFSKIMFSSQTPTKDIKSYGFLENSTFSAIFIPSKPLSIHSAHHLLPPLSSFLPAFLSCPFKSHSLSTCSFLYEQEVGIGDESERWEWFFFKADSIYQQKIISITDGLMARLLNLSIALHVVRHSWVLHVPKADLAILSRNSGPSNVQTESAPPNAKRLASNRPILLRPQSPLPIRS